VIAILIFVAGSAPSGLGHSIGQLVALRVIPGLGANS
jgi:hypothetical protein